MSAFVERDARGVVHMKWVIRSEGWLTRMSYRAQQLATCTEDLDLMALPPIADVQSPVVVHVYILRIVEASLDQYVRYGQLCRRGL
ncbi:hypothetical protein DIE17_30620 [Burkholderia sp. Bp9099]|nr:hypothetical protein DIE17_30620 [Burkholderia sp. Bp9099]